MHERFNVIQPREISLKNHPELNEAWLQEVISHKPEILGLGDLNYKIKGGRINELCEIQIR